MTESPALAPDGSPWSIVDLFAGPGGLDVAARWLGVPVRGIEWDANACATRAAAGLKTLAGDVRDHGPGEFAGANVLAGGPPCQTFTVAGHGAGRRNLEQVLSLVKRMSVGDDVRRTLGELSDERTGLVLEPLRWILDARKAERPFEAVVLEQVPAVLPVWAAYAEVLEGIGYNCDLGVLRSEEFGVPQTRRRAILVARLSSQAKLPAPTHRRFVTGVARGDGDASLLPWQSMRDALPLRAPFTVVSNYGTGGDPKARGRRTSDQPSATVTGKVRRNLLVVEGRTETDRFSLQEAGKLQTFPLDFPWRGRDVAQQIGNAIPPRMGAHVLASALELSTDELNWARILNRWS
ncbi:DNA cytosine methyltransferase [Kineococcus sp. SYSU DK003]|uniref:DNA cytosine methyltransferase n=1 Tax=Kineococcus sp. SYSU DK003 TaxID=3383124 RepID=UPI003D7E6658